MRYQAIDGTILESDSNKPVTHRCQTDHPEGTFVSFETTGSSNPIGIQQIKIVRTVVNGIMTIEITESSEQELLDYLEQIKTNNVDYGN